MGIDERSTVAQASIVYRRGLLSDTEKIVEAARAHVNESSLASIAHFDADACKNFVINLLKLPPNLGCVVLAIDDKNEIAGMTVCVASRSLFFADRTIGSEVSWYVAPAYRKAGIGSKLLEYFEEWCRVSGHYISQLELQHPGLEDYITSKGYNRTGQTYVKVI